MPNKVVAIYARVSTAEQAREGYSIHEQVKRLTSYSEAMGWTIYKTYIDAGMSGSNMDRSALNDLFLDIKNIDTVLVYKLDRLSRSQKDTLHIIEDIFLANNVDFVSMTESFDTSTSFGRAMVGILAVFAQLERENIKERVMVGKQARAEQGKFHGSKWIPIGYDYIDGSLVVNEYEAMQVRTIYELFNSGKSVSAIVRYMNSSGLKHKYGDWVHPTTKHALQSKTYLGLLKHRDKWHQGEHEAIIDEDTWKRADERFKERVNTPTLGKRYSSALGGLCTCGHCGARYTRRLTGRKNKTGEFRYYYSCYSRNKVNRHLIKDPNCKNKIYRKEELENAIFDEVRKLAFDPNAVENIWSTQQRNDFTKEIELIEKQIEDFNEQLSNLVQLFAIGNMDIAIVEKKMNEIQDAKMGLQKELEYYKKANTKTTMKETHDLAASISPIFDSGDDDAIRAALRQLISDIVIDNDIITIHWKIA